MVEYFKRAEQIDPNHPQVKKSAKDIHKMEQLREKTIKEYEDILDMVKKGMKNREN